MPHTYSEQQERTTALDFQELESLRIFSKQILRDQKTSLDYFAYYPGYQHFRGKAPKISVSSSATCVLSLVATGKWTADNAQTKALLREITSKKKSAGLKNNKPFTIAWILEAVESLKSLPIVLDGVTKTRAARMDAVLQQH